MGFYHQKQLVDDHFLVDSPVGRSIFLPAHFLPTSAGSAITSRFKLLDQSTWGAVNRSGQDSRLADS
ncbi:hypothetical protein Enr13x_25040 [Stieleria neptunia]|uniref:Uncharacterized protein n=1 Tax=Stieleria neptunia TaxID=2527979 RepID=A0A518HP85_9BACT|nr:hypothetical protein [Stieleria neptunia]QDV42655.1 hypothetical protein Enr13x_25040 [Stieleria neptunia]